MVNSPYMGPQEPFPPMDPVNFLTNLYTRLVLSLDTISSTSRPKMSRRLAGVGGPDSSFAGVMVAANTWLPEVVVACEGVTGGTSSGEKIARRAPEFSSFREADFPARTLRSRGVTVVPGLGLVSSLDKRCSEAGMTATFFLRPIARIGFWGVSCSVRATFVGVSSIMLLASPCRFFPGDDIMEILDWRRSAKAWSLRLKILRWIGSLAVVLRFLVC